MGFALSSVTKGPEIRARKIIIYGPPKLGKSTLASSAKDSLLIPTEDRVAHINCSKVPVCRSYSEVYDVMETLIQEKGKHPYKRIIFDSIDWLEPLLHDYVLSKIKATAKTQPKSLTDDNCKETAFFKGLKYHAVEGWKSFLSNCDILVQCGFDVIFVAHSRVLTINSPDLEPYDMNVMKIDKFALSVVEEWADIIAYYDKKTYVYNPDTKPGAHGKVTTQNERKLHLSGNNPAMMSGNSFGLTDIESVKLESCTEVMEGLLTMSNNFVPAKEVKTNKKGE